MSDEAIDTALAESRQLLPLVKAHFVGVSGGVRSTTINEPERVEANVLGGGEQALEPAYDPRVLAMIYENSSNLRPNVDAYITNIDSFGHAYIPIIETTAVDADEKIRDALRIERLRAKSDSRNAVNIDVLVSADEPSDADVKKRKELLEVQIRTERQWLGAFFDNCTFDMPFSGPEGLRGLTRQDIEVTGSGYWEVLRNGLGEIMQFNHVPSVSVRLMPLDSAVTNVEVERRVSLLTTEKISVVKRYRRFVQTRGDVNFSLQNSGNRVYFKEFGDPRIISSRTGKVYGDIEQMRASDEDKDSLLATEILPFRITSARGSYGVPRWIGTLVSVLGTRQAEEVNLLYFENRSVPPMAILVSGGHLNEGTVERIESYISTEIKGMRNFHKIMILEAESGDTVNPNSGKMKIEIKPLTDSQQKDALFQNYDERNSDKVGQSFRMPRILRGDVRDFNRSCYSEDTETLTQNGWKTYDQIGPDEKIAAFDTKTDQVVFVVPEKKLVYDVRDEELIRFANKKTDCLVTKDHRMYVSAGGKNWEVLQAEQVKHAKFKVKVAGSKWEGREETKFVLPKSCKIERGHSHREGVRFDDWLEFLGYFISEGGLVLTDHPSAEYLVYIDQKKPLIRERIRSCLDRLGWTYSTQIKPCGTTHFLFSNRCLRDWLVANVGHNSHDWHIPNEYLSLSKRQLKILFDAMMAGDGSVGRNGTSWAYYSASRTLVDQVQQLLVQTGYRAHIRRSEAAKVWRVCFSEGTTTQLHAVGAERTPPSVTRERYTGKVYCFSVPDFGFFVTRRNGKVAIQGNTAEASIGFAEVQVFGPIRQQFDWIINKLIFPALGVQYHTFRSNAPTVRDPEALAKMIALLVSSSILTPAEARNLAQDVFNCSFENINDDWVKKPLAITLAEANAQGKDALEDFKEGGGMSAPNAGAAQRQTGVQQAPPKTTPDDRSKPKPKSNDAVRAQAKAILNIQKSLLEADLEDSGMSMETDEDGLQKVVIKVPKEEFESWWKKPT